MDIGSVKIAVGLNVDIYRGTFEYLYEKGIFPAEISIGIGKIHFDPPNLQVRDPSGTPTLLFRFSGQFPNGNIPNDPFSIVIRLKPSVTIETVTDDDDNSWQTPYAVLEIDEVDSVTPSAASALVPRATSMISGFLANMKMNVFDKLIAGIESAFFEVNHLPGRETWAVNFILAKAAELERIQVGFPPGHPDQPRVESSTILQTQAALLATVALPGEDPNMPGMASILPEKTGLQTFISRSAMDAKLLKDSLEKVDQNLEGAVIRSLEMRMHELGIEIHGKAEKSIATITWDGIILIFFSRLYKTHSGSIRLHDGYINVFTSGVDVDVDLPWYVTFLRVLLYFLGPLGWILDSSLIQPKLKQGDKAPDIVRGAFREEVGEALKEMLIDSGGLSDEDEVPFSQFNSDAWVLNGHYTTSSVAFAGLNYDTIERIELDTFSIYGASGASVGLIHTGNGFVFHPEEAGKFLKDGVLVMPGYHGVAASWGYYVRSNPNDDTTDNLVDPGLIEDYP